MLRRIASRKWRSRLNWNGRWFVRQSSFSGFARRSFLRQLWGEKDRWEGASPVRFFRFASAFECYYLLYRILYLLYLCFSFFLAFLSLSLSLSLAFHFLARSMATRHMDAYEERPLRRTWKRPRESSSRFASLVKRTRDFAYRTPSRPFFPLCLSLLSSLISSLILCLPRFCYILFLSFVSIFRGDTCRSFMTFNEQWRFFEEKLDREGN